jgi:signal transduction histidine kinase
MARSDDRLPQLIFVIAAGFMFGAVFLRTLLIYGNSPKLGLALGLLLAWLLLSLSEPAISRRWPGYFAVYLVLQTALVFALLTMPDPPDFFAALLAILSMQVMLRLNPKIGALWIGLCGLIMIPLLARLYRTETVALTLIYTGVNAIFGSYALATRHAQEARVKNQALAQELAEGNQELQAYSAQLEGMAVARERSRLARELHDALTQTVFSMHLTVQSARLLFDRDPQQAGEQLERLGQLAQSALSEMRLLISELPVEDVADGGLVSALRRHLAGGRIPESLSVSLEEEGDEPLPAAEERGLFRIAQEALNNIVKHAGASRARVHLHLAEPFWIEIEDDGQGFDLQQAQNGNRVGLIYLRERAAEIGWDLGIMTSPGAGTRIRVARRPGRGVEG